MKIAITGGIGSGKSTVSNIIKNLGYTVVSTDEITAKLHADQNVLLKIKEIFPSAVTGEKQLFLDKNILSEEIFFDKEKLSRLNKLMHPLIMNNTFDILDKYPVAFAEVPLLFESKLESMFDKVIVVKRDKNSRVSSVIKRSNLTENQVLSRINNQIDYDTFDFSKYNVIINDNLDMLEQKVKNLLAEYGLKV